MRRIVRDADLLTGALLFLCALGLYLRTLAPSVVEMFDDSLEFQLIAGKMAIAHPTGYPLYSLLLKLASLVPVGDVATRANLASALFAALAVVALYAAARQIVSSRAAALTGALLFSAGPVFWSQAINAEVYSLQALLTAGLVYLALAWGKQDSKFEIAKLKFLSPLVLLAFFSGLALTHHRLSAFVVLAVAVYVLLYGRAFLREPRTLLTLAAAFGVPLLLYLYIPLRGLSTSSLDGTYQNTPAGFVSWILGLSYNVFLTDNPFKQQRELSYYLDLFLGQFTWIGLALAALGLLALARRAWREALFLSLALALNLAFVVSYRVADIDVFAIPAFLLTAVLSIVGLDAIAAWARCFAARAPLSLRGSSTLAAVPLVVLVFLLIPAWLVRANYSRLDLSGKWDVHDYGRDILSAPLPGNATLIGLGGEMSLVELFRDTQGLRPEIQTVRADKEGERLAAVDRALQAGRTVFLTRPLPGAPEKYSLASFGPLILVQPRANKTTAPGPAHRLDADYGGLTLLGYDLDSSRLGESATWHLSNGRTLRVTLYWQVRAKPTVDLQVSLKLLDASGGRAAQLDRQPVLDAYPITSWRTGEFISDTYDLPVLIGAPAGDYVLQATLYDPNTGEVHGQSDLGKVMLAPDTYDHSPLLLDVEHKEPRDFGGVSFSGYSLETAEPYDAGDGIPVTLLFRSQDARPHPFEIALRDGDFRVIDSRPLTIAAAPGQYVRFETDFAVPSPRPRGPLRVELVRVPRDELACDLPLVSTCVTLGDIRLGK